MLIGESNVAIDPAIGGYGVADIYLGEFSPHDGVARRARARAGADGGGAAKSENRGGARRPATAWDAPRAVVELKVFFAIRNPHDPARRSIFVGWLCTVVQPLDSVACRHAQKASVPRLPAW